MEMSLKKFLDPKMLRSRIGRPVVFAGFLALIVFLAYSYAPIVKVGTHSTTYTYADVQEVYSFSNKVAAIARSKKVTSSRDSVFQSLMISGIEKEILDARKIPQYDKDKAVAEILAQSPYGGLLEEERAKLGDDCFYKLFILPVVVDKDFGRYYMAKDANRATAEVAIKAAQLGGLTAATGKAGVQVVRSAIPINNNTAQLAAEAKKSIGSVLPKLVEDGSGYAIVQPVEVNDTQIICDVVFIPRQSINAFVEAELKEANVPVKDYVYSWFRVASLREQGGVLAVVQSTKKPATAAKEGE